MFPKRCPLLRRSLVCVLALAGANCARAQIGQFDQVPVKPEDEAYIFTPEGFDREGQVMAADPHVAGTLKLLFRNKATGQPTPCRVNVVGPDGNYYHPKSNRFTPYSLTGEWPDKGYGNRRGKAPIQYFGRFFYTDGTAEVEVPPGQCRVEVWKGFEYHPERVTVDVSSRQTQAITIDLERSTSMAANGYYSGDSHLHLARSTEDDETTAFDLLEAEDVRFGSIHCYNLDTSSYTGIMDRQDYPQRRGLGKASLKTRGDYHIQSGQEYRSGVYGHLKLFERDSLVLADDTIDPNRWPVFGLLARETIDRGGYAFYAHGGYAQEIYADLVQGNVQGVELLQFGIYRGIGLEGWYRILNVGYRFPAEGASDYPPCRKFADCRTYVRIEGEPTFAGWYQGLAAGKSFFTTGPLLELAVRDELPGAVLSLASNELAAIPIRVRVRSPVAPISRLQIIANGKVVREMDFESTSHSQARKEVPEQKSGIRYGAGLLYTSLKLTGPTWIAARVYSTAPTGSPDAEAHTNPVYINVDGKRPYDPESLAWLRNRIEEQRAAHQKRNFDGNEKVVRYFQTSLDMLDVIQTAGGIVESSEEAK